MARVHHCLPPPRAAVIELALVETPSRAAVKDDGPAGNAGGPGWFESSWDLRRGLEVREGLPNDANLDEWLTVCLGVEAAAPYRPVARATASPRSITAIA